MSEIVSEKLLNELSVIKNLLILIASKSGATSAEIGKVIGTGDSRVRQILTGNVGSKKKNSRVRFQVDE